MTGDSYWRKHWHTIVRRKKQVKLFAEIRPKILAGYSGLKTFLVTAMPG